MTPRASLAPSLAPSVATERSGDWRVRAQLVETDEGEVVRVTTRVGRVRGPRVDVPRAGWPVHPLDQARRLETALGVDIDHAHYESGCRLAEACARAVATVFRAVPAI